MEQDQPYLSTKDLAERYGITERTIKKWRTSTRRGKAEGPEWYDVPRQATALGKPLLRYALPQVLAWEETNSIIPIKSF